MPLTGDLQRRVHATPRQRQLFKNIIYLGALSALLDIDPAEIEKLFGEQYKGKEALLESNRKAFRMGRDYALAHFACPLPIRVAPQRPRRRPHLHRRQQRRGAGLRLRRRDGLRVVPDHAVVVARRGVRQRTARKFRTDPVTGKKRYAIVQAEDELASIGMVIGAAWNGARAFTATSGPGISLMQEFLGLAYFAEIPVVLFDVQRGSPSTGMPTRTQQADLLSCAYASHGDTKHVLLLPEDPTEAFEMGAQAFDLADRLQTPIFVMLDLDIGMQDWLTEPFAWDDSARDGPRQGDDRGRARGRPRLRPLPRRRRRRHRRTAPIPARIRRRAASSRAARRRTATRATPRTASPTSTTCSGCSASSRPRRRWCRPR